MNDKEIIEVLKHAIQNVEKGDAAGKGIEFFMGGAHVGDSPGATLKTVISCLVTYDKLQIKRKTINFNGVEIAAPETEAPEIGVKVWMSGFDENGKPVPKCCTWGECEMLKYALLCSTIWLDESECQKFCDARNKMMGVCDE